MSPTVQDFARLISLGLRPHWLAAPEPNKPHTGKRPLDKAWEQRAYSTEPTPPPFPGANLGLRTGRVEGAPLQVVVVDLDSDAALGWARGGNIPETPWRTKTGKGEHWYYRYPGDAHKISNKCRFTLPSGDKLEIDVRGDGGNVVVAPSVHPSGHVYAEIGTWDQAPIDWLPIYDPSWLDRRKKTASKRKILEEKSQTPVKTAAEFEEPDSLLAPLPTDPPTERPGLLPEQFQARLYQSCEKRLGGDGAIAALRRMAQEQNYAPNGERNNTLFQAVRLLAEWFPDATDEQLEDFARVSVLATGDQEPQKELENFHDVLRRAREKFAQRDHLLLRLAKASIEPTQALIGAGTDLPGRLILTFGTGNHLVMLPDGSYSNSIWKQEKLAQHIDHPNLLGWAERAQIAQFHFIDEKGKRKRVSWPTLAERHGWPVNHWIGSFSALFSMVQGDTFIEAFAPRRRDLAPCFDQYIQNWLFELGGADRDLLLDWLAGFSDLDSPAPALVLVGARKAGKNLLAEGLARFWVAGSPIPFETTTRDFNDALQQCPLLFADEKLPIDAKGRVQLDEHLRQLVTARAHQVRRKYRDDVTVRGCLRIIVATNQENFDFVGMSEESKAALAERILHIEVNPSARTYLEKLGGRATTDAWVQGDGLIRHVMWLSETRAVQRGDRLIVQGNGERLIDTAQNLKGAGADLCTWLCSYLEDPKAASIGPSASGLIIRNGEVWVSARILFAGGEDTWHRFVRHSRAVLPPLAQRVTLLGGLSGGVTRKFRVPNGPKHGNPAQAVYHKLQLHQLYRWAERFGFDVEAIQATVAGGNTPEPGPGSGDLPELQPVPPSNNSALPPRPPPIAYIGQTLPDWPDALGPAASDQCRDEQGKCDGTCEVIDSFNYVGDAERALASRGGVRLNDPRDPRTIGPRPLSELLGATPSEVPDANVVLVPAPNNSAEVLPGQVAENATPSVPEPLPTRAARHRKPCSAARVGSGEPCVCPPRAAPKPKEKPRAVREPAYYTPDLCAWAEELGKALPETEERVVEFFAPRLTIAMRGHPSTFARLTAAYRRYREALRISSDPKEAFNQTMLNWFGVHERPWFMDVSLTQAPAQGGVS